jgi:hypothetical protein
MAPWTIVLDGSAWTDFSMRASALLACPLSRHREMCWGSQAMPAIFPPPLRLALDIPQATTMRRESAATT